VRAAFHTLGCKVNQCETEALIQSFQKKGYEIVSEDSFADIYIINTCTVTGLADRKSRQYIRRAKKINPKSVIAVTGCYAEVAPDEIKGTGAVDIIVNNADKMSLPDNLERLLIKRANDPVTEATESIIETKPKTRAFIKIQDGCDRFCSYCIVPYARSEMRSRPLEQIISEAEALIKNGYKELVIAGINTALYKTEEGYGLTDIISEISGLIGDFRIRLSSLEPTVVDADHVKELFKFDKLCHHLHLSLQSGSDRILALMNRKYELSGYMDIVKSLKGFDACYGISTDMIAGFPGESEGDFLESLKVVEGIDFCKIHVFKYSARKGTAAAKMEGQIGGIEKNQRSARLISGGDMSARRFFENNTGKIRRVLIEEYLENNCTYTGYTDNYIRVYIKGNYFDSASLNTFTIVKLTGLYGDGMKGVPEKS